MNSVYYRISDICKIKSGKRLPAGHDFSSEPTPYRYIRARDIKSGKITLDDTPYIDEGTRQRIKKYIINAGDIAITIVANIGDIGYANKDCDGINLTENAVRLTSFDENVVYPKYLAYYLAQPFIKTYMENLAARAAQSKLGIYKIEKMKVELPRLSIQKEIVRIIEKFDRLIEFNRNRIKTLERMAEELYKEWFVRFRFPGHETAEFENGIPKGWDIVRMNNFCYVTDGTHDTPAPTIDGVPLVTGKSLKEGFVDFSETYNISIKDHKQIKKRSGLKDGDILFSNIGTVGSTCVVDYDREFSVKNVIIFKLDSIEKTVYLYLWLNSKPMQDIFSMQTNGSSQQFVGLTFMRKYKVMAPQQNVLEKFCSLVNPIFEERKILHRENEYLMKQRGLLLPRLMSGKLEV